MVIKKAILFDLFEEFKWYLDSSTVTGSSDLISLYHPEQTYLCYLKCNLGYFWKSAQDLTWDDHVEKNNKIYLKPCVFFLDTSETKWGASGDFVLNSAVSP